MSTTPVMDPFQQQQPPPMVMAQQANTSNPGHGSVGPVIGVLAVITVLGAIAIMIGRLCSGRRIMGHGQYDFETWAETKCASCIDGRLSPPPRRVVVAESSTTSTGSGQVGTAAVQQEEETPRQETTEEGVSNQQHHHHHHHQQDRQHHERAEP